MEANALSPNAQAARAQAGGTYYGLMYLAFATLAYTDESHGTIIHVGSDLSKAVAGLAPPPVPSGDTAWGAWSLDWGPALYGTDENLMYIASFRESPGATPVMTVLAIRGTDISAGAVAIMGQLVEDLDDWLHVQWSRATGDQFQCVPDVNPADQSPKIAAGTCQGLQHLRSLTQTPAGGTTAVNAETYLASLLQQDPAIPIVVTGHSLGGCQATAMAMYLANALPSGTRILPNPFAPPTAGNAAFAGMYDQSFPEGNVWWNNLDLVPNAYARGDANTPGNLSYAEGLWQKSGGPANPLLAGIIRTLQSTLPVYTQPTAGSVALTGSVATPSYLQAWFNEMDPVPKTDPKSWGAQLMWQHFPPNYYKLMTEQVQGIAPYKYAGDTPPPSGQS